MNLEVAHFHDWSAPDLSERADFEFARAEKFALRNDTRLDQVTVCLLIDDKSNLVHEREIWLDEKSSALPALFGRVDYICFESDLVTILPQLLEHLREASEQELAKSVLRYHQKKGHLACSHDIALWHGLRLGLFDGWRDMTLAWSHDAQTGARDFVCQIAGAILEEKPVTETREADEYEYRNEEEQALAVLMPVLQSAGIDSERIVNDFYVRGAANV